MGPAFDRVLTPTPYGMALTAKELSSLGASGPSLALVALYDPGTQTWTRLPDTGQIGGWTWTWTGTRLVAPEFGSADGGRADNWGRSYPYGGAISLPDGGWSPVKINVKPMNNLWGDTVVAIGGRYALAGGYIYDDDARTWTPATMPANGPASLGKVAWAGDRFFAAGGITGGSFDPGVWELVP
jgi:hypothetical protein